MMGFRMRQWTFMVSGLLALLGAGPVLAHFQELLPNEPIIEEETQRSVTLRAVFTHPMEGGPIMDMGPPKAFGVIGRDGQRTDLLSTLRNVPVGGKSAYTAQYTLRGPANYVFFIEPAPYWEPAEKKMLIHYTKVVVNAYGADDGWDAMTGAPIEIRPLTRPFGLWTGNVFNGIVMYNGKPSPFTRIEVEYKADGKIKAPADPFVTQVIKSDANGNFSYAMPRAGWWGFSAIVAGAKKIANPSGEMVDLEEGGLIWVQTVNMR